SADTPAPVPARAATEARGSFAGPESSTAQEQTVRVEARHEIIGRQAISQLTYLDISGLGWSVEFHAGRDDFLGMADGQRLVIDIWVRDDHDVTEVLGTLAHEMAHVLDLELWTEDVRERWLELRGLDLLWWPSCTCDDRDFGSGDIAEAMAMLEAGRGQWAGLNGVPTPAQLDWLRSIV
ncbi:MAG: hypothetical protein ACI867_001632, partial [Glaciecola sp.]